MLRRASKRIVRFIRNGGKGFIRRAARLLADSLAQGVCRPPPRQLQRRGIAPATRLTPGDHPCLSANCIAPGCSSTRNGDVFRDVRIQIFHGITERLWSPNTAQADLRPLGIRGQRR